MNLYQMRGAVQNLGEVAKADNEKYQEVLLNPKATSEEISEKQKIAADSKQRYEGMREQYNEAKKAEDEAAAADAEDPKKKKATDTPAEKDVNAFAERLRGVIKSGQSIDLNGFKQAAGVSVNGEDGPVVGDNFLPITLSNEVISEPDMPNPLRGVISTSSMVNLRIPALDVEFGDAFKTIGEGSEANEAEVSGKQITFGRFESKVRIGFTDTLVAGTSLALLQYAQQKLANGASMLELARAFASTPVVGEEHMSLYDASNGIKHIAGDDLFTAILDALADLSDADVDQAAVFMKRADYNKIIKVLANGSATLYAAQPESVIGVPVYFTSYAVKPVVGNFAMYHQNYDPQGSLIEQYRKPETGVTYAQYTLWYDAAIKRPSAFRIVDVAASSAKGE